MKIKEEKTTFVFGSTTSYKVIGYYECDSEGEVTNETY